jgi:hypothetical protein
VTGAALLGLLDGADRAVAELRHQRRLDRDALVSEDGDDRLGAQLARQVHGVADQGAPQQPVQNLHVRRAHARPLAGGQDDAGQLAG